MKKLFCLIVPALLLSSAPAAAQYDDPREAARKAAELAMAKAQADKARNDAIVEQQRAAERARAQRASKPSNPQGSTTPQ